MTAYAICAAGLSGLTIESNYKGYNSLTHGGSLACTSGQLMLGAGFTAENYPQYTVLQTLLPGGEYAGQQLLSSTVSENDTGTASNWGLRLHAICGDA